nr:PREDICTED: protein-associating with the carboxyl-terminal domain of ezrin [Bemisia tabaci]
MGNESSRNQLSGLVIDEKAFEVTDNWTLYSANYSSGSNPKVSVFIEASQHSSSLSPLHLFAKNLMLHRHPCILKYIASWTKSGKLYLATEDVRPLSHVINSLTSIQKCIGLYSILKALVFLHEQAKAAHLNVCKASIYVTSDGSWKLGGLEFLKRFQDLTLSYLQETKSKRYIYGIAPNEDDCAPQPPTIIDQYAFGVLADEILEEKSNDQVPALKEFKDTCINCLRSGEPSERPSLSQVLRHPFFTHEFITVHNFLSELAIKTQDQKTEFFKSLAADLKVFPENLIASQLGSLLLSRLVLLDSAAQACLLPHLLTPRSDEYPESLFSDSVFSKFIVPKLLSIFCVRDSQVRLILLKYFKLFCSSFTQQQLQLQILPELLLGIKDTSDELVCATLHALADLVPVLGSAVVIGGKRSRIFADGRPKLWKEPEKDHESSKKSLESDLVSSEIITELMLHERPSPDGGEDLIQESQNCNSNSSHLLQESNDDDNEQWIDWESPQEKESSVGVVEKPRIAKKDSIDEIKSLGIFVKPKEVKPDEIDALFQDMEPVISKTPVAVISENGSTNKFDVASIEDQVEDGWADDIDDWGAVSDDNFESISDKIQEPSS